MGPREAHSPAPWARWQLGLCPETNRVSDGSHRQQGLVPLVLTMPLSPLHRDQLCMHVGQKRETQPGGRLVCSPVILCT